MSGKRRPPKRRGKGPRSLRDPKEPSAEDVEALQTARAILAIKRMVARIPSAYRRTIRSVAPSGATSLALRNPRFARCLALLEKDVIDILRLLPPSLKTRALIARLSAGRPAQAHPMQSSAALNTLDALRKSVEREAAYKPRHR